MTARTRRVGRGALLVMLSVCAAARAAGEDERSESPWRVELAGHGAWLPGEGTRGAAGAGVSVGYTFISLGVEAWAYHLTLHDSLNDERRDYDTEVVALTAGLRFPISGTHFVMGGALGPGLNTGGESLQVGYCANHYYGPWVVLARVYGAYVAGPFEIGPHVGYTHDVSGASGDACSIFLNGPDPYQKRYPHRLPFGIQLGLSVRVGAP